MRSTYVKNLIKDAIEIVKDINDSYRIPAFQVILFYFLTSYKKEEIKPMAEKPEDKLTSSVFNFLKEHNISKHSERVLFMSYYLYNYRNVDPINVDDIKEMYLEARIKEPANLTDTLNKQEKKGFLMAQGTKNNLKAYRLTMNGIKFVESHLREEFA